MSGYDCQGVAARCDLLVRFPRGRGRAADGPMYGPQHFEGAQQVEPNSSQPGRIQQDAPPVPPSTSPGSPPPSPHRAFHGRGSTRRTSRRASIVASGVRLRREPRPVPLAPPPGHRWERVARPRARAGEGGRERMGVAVALAPVVASLSQQSGSRPSLTPRAPPPPPSPSPPPPP